MVANFRGFVIESIDQNDQMVYMQMIWYIGRETK